MGGVCSPHGLSPLALWALILEHGLCCLGDSDNGVFLCCFVVSATWCFSLCCRSVSGVCQLHVLFHAGCFGWVGCSLGALVVYTGYIFCGSYWVFPALSSCGFPGMGPLILIGSFGPFIRFLNTCWAFAPQCA